MDVKLVLLALTLLNEVWVGSCCCKRRSRYASVEIQIKIEVYCRRRRSIDYRNETHTDILRQIGTDFSIAFEEALCVFETYDTDNDGMITKEELEAKFGARKETQELLAFVDETDDDGIIDYYEFCAAVPFFISKCNA